MPWPRLLAGTLAAAIASGGAAAAAETLHEVTIGVVPTAQSATTFYALEHGFFRDAGVDLKIEMITQNSNLIPLVSTNRVQVAEGGYAAGYFNALATDVPVVLALERGGSPIYHDLLVRPDLKDKIKTLADLKGRSVALPSPGTILTYELGKTLETAGLSLDDVEVKYVGFDKMGVALQNGAIDAALEVPPYGRIVIGQGAAVRWIDPDDYVRPTPYETNVYFANTDWIKAEPALAQRFFVAMVRGAREYCQAYHHDDAVRAEMLDLLVKYKVTTDRELLEQTPWQARDPNGRFNLASVLDIQHWFRAHGIIKQEFPAERIVDARFAEAAARELGPFVVRNKTSTLAGCR